MALGLSRLRLLTTAALVALTPANTEAAHTHRALRAPASSYVYAGVVYDRLFSVTSRPRFSRGRVATRRDARLHSLAIAPYAITDLTPIAGVASGEGTPDGFGSPTAVNNAGHITYYDECECVGNTNNIALVIDDDGTYSRILYENEIVEGADSAIPYAISANGNSAGEEDTQYGPGDSHQTVVAWSQAGGLYESGASDRTFALAINDAGTSVGHDTGAKGSYAAAFSLNARGAVARALLAPPKNTSWIGTATGINDAGEIVGYATAASGSARAVRFSTSGNAQVLPVGAAGVSTSAQAINQHGDVVGSAGSQAFLYLNNRVAYLPVPPGDGPGNAVAYAVNASDQVVGDLMTSPTTSTAFLYSGGRSYDLDALLPANSGWQIVHASGINDSGQIVGVGYYAGEGGALTAFSMKPAPQTAPGTIATYTKGITGYPQNIIRGPDGNMWFTETVGGSLWIGKITHDGVVTQFSKGVLHVNPPGGIASGSDGNVWFSGNNIIGKITPAGAVTEYTAGISADADPSSLVAGPDGNVWFVEPKLDRVGKITPAGVVTEYSKGLPANGGSPGPTAITAGADGNLWFIATGVPEASGDSIGKITPGGSVTLYPYPGALSYLYPTQISNGPDGNVWVASFSETTKQPGIAKVTPSGDRTSFPAGVVDVDERPGGITAGPDGNIWYDEVDDDVQQICKITPAGATTCYSNGLVQSNFLDKIANGGDGYLWFTTYNTKTVKKIHS